MNYIEVTFTCEPNNEIISSILSASLADIGFESFVETDNGLTAYIQETQFDESNINQVISDFPMEAAITFEYTTIESKDWNEEWEKNYFQPLIIDNTCSVQSTFHDFESDCQYKIVVDPKMAFGTGHHQTTELMIRQILQTGCEGKAVLDMGCGTAILAILASMKGANPITAIDIDQWAYDNAIENLNLNHITNIGVQIGGAELLGKERYDIILANINRNILLNDIHAYVSVLNDGGLLFMSGFYTEDIPAIQAECEKYNLHYEGNISKDNWASVKFSK
ncbi:50S ribosomal protein L11 methyltransferase [Dysgonomonas sp. 25]|uniref:50S ribosomal protein L11 methyltransferase n=1 Tax=Dysgonomonas sp. 25 TaxID=2302933 RepID=UPI0013D12947|nr:50S ribosomal protein L11 methyltransferase [Dysgonomonas sp. 25]NDV67633.1 50S ribosomal protein L11 methyltransferase [Dysgonomonas sp. 25]